MAFVGGACATSTVASPSTTAPASSPSSPQQLASVPQNSTVQRTGPMERPATRKVLRYVTSQRLPGQPLTWNAYEMVPSPSATQGSVVTSRFRTRVRTPPSVVT